MSPRWKETCVVIGCIIVAWYARFSSSNQFAHPQSPRVLGRALAKFRPTLFSIPISNRRQQRIRRYAESNPGKVPLRMSQGDRKYAWD